MTTNVTVSSDQQAEQEIERITQQVFDWASNMPMGSILEFEVVDQMEKWHMEHFERQHVGQQVERPGAQLQRAA